MRAKPPRHRPDHRSLLHYAHLLTTIHLHNCSPTCYLGTPSAPPYKPDPVHPRLSVVPLPSPRTIQLQHTTAVRRGAASRRCWAVVQRRGQGHGAGVVTAVPSWVAKRPQTLRPGRGLAAQRVVAGREDVRTPTMPVVALSASAVRRADVRPIGRADVRCPRVRCPRDRCHPGVRTDGPSVSAAMQPRCPDRAGPWNGSVRRAVPVGRNGVRGAAVVRGVVACPHGV